MSAHLRPEHVRRILELQGLCRTQEEIAAELGCSVKTVQRHLYAANRKAQWRLHHDITMERSRQVACLRWLQREAVKGWEAGPKDPEGKATRYLAAALACMA